MGTAVTTPSPSVVRTARTAVFTAFAINGAAFAAFASRVPDLKFELSLSAGELGLTLLAASLGSVIGLPIFGFDPLRGAPPAPSARRSSRASASSASGWRLGRPEPSARHAGALPRASGTGIFDVGMNLEGTQVEQLLGWAIMPHFHAAFSGGTVVSALAGAGLSALHVPIAVHLGGVVVILLAVTPWFLRAFLPRTIEFDEHGSQVHEKAGIGRAWLEPRTLLIGVVVFAAAFTEGTANDWIGVALSDGYGLPRWTGVLGFAVFLTAMTAGRLLGTRVLDRRGRVPVLRVLFVAAVVGCLLVVFGGPVLAFVGAAVWGVGASLGFPVGMSAAADEPLRAAARISVVTTIGYTAFLAGPPLLGFLGDEVGVLHSLLVVGALAIVALFAVPAVREPRPTSSGPAGTPAP